MPVLSQLLKTLIIVGVKCSCYNLTKVIMYHIDDLKKFVRCPILYFYSRGVDNSNHYLRSDESIIELLAKHLKVDEYYRGLPNDPNSRFIKEKDLYQWFVKTRFEYCNLRIKIPLMHKNNDGYDIYFLYNGTSLKELDLFYYRINLEVLANLNIEVKNVYLAYINGDYVYKDHLDVDELFIIIDRLNGKKLLDIFEEEVCDFKYIINRIESTSIESYKPKKTRACHNRNVCDYYYECFKEEKELPDDSILTLVSSQNKGIMYKKGIKLLKDADLNLVEGNRVQYAQIMASRNNGFYVNKFALKEWIKKLDARPISFIDFEWDTYLVPQYEKMKPLNVLPFEFVLYVLDENGNMNHYSFVGKGDCRKEFLDGLLKYIPKNGPIVAYNAFGAECYRIKELANYFPEYSKELLEINSRFCDLAQPFLEGLIYDVRMKGNFSLKSLVNMISNYSYKELEINDGMKAVYNWRDIDKNKENVDDKKVLNDLIQYCSLDAYGLYLVYNWLLKNV